jgi:hypothetical protein
MSTEEYNGLMAAILSLQAATADGFARVDREFASARGEVGSLRGEVGSLRSEVGSLRSEMMRRFDRVEVRLSALEPKRKRPQDRE